jgi:ABC-type sugar transport system ATPase subunit
VQTRAEIARLHQRLQATMIYVTHDQVEAMTMADRIAVISNGVLQQVGTPKQLYEEPCNRFVAGFIGSPSMNFVELKVQREGVMRLVCEGTQVVLDDAMAAQLRHLGLEAATVGVRPEHLRVGEPEGPGLRVSATVDVVEFLGNDALIHAASEGRDVVAIVGADTRLAVGDTVILSAAPRHVYLFEPQSEMSLGAR